MRFRHLLALLLVVSVAMLTGCGGGGGSSGGSAGTTITTRLVAPTTSGGSLRGSVKAAFAEEVVKGATVTLTMADGTTYTMTDNGNGEYSATVTSIPGAGGFYIEAHKGDLELQNMFTSMPEDPNGITTDYLSTAFTQVALAFAKSGEYGTNSGIENPVDLLSNLTSISIEFNQLRTEITDETNVTYTQTRTMFQAALAGADTDKANTETTLIDQLTAGTLEPEIGGETYKWTETISPLNPPVSAPADDEAAITAAAKTFLNTVAKYFSAAQLQQAEIASLSDVVSNNFIHQGMDKSILLNQLAQAYTDKEDFTFDHFEGDVVLRKIDADTYLVGLLGKVFEKDSEGTISAVPEDSFKFGYNLGQIPSGSLFPTTYTAYGLDPDNMFPVIVKRESGVWKVIGNGIKINEIWMNLTNRYEAKAPTPGARTNLWFDVKDTARYQVTSVTISGGKLDAPISLAKKPELADADKWYYWWTDPNNNLNTHPSGYPNQGWDSKTKHANGDKYTIRVTFQDGTTQTFEHIVANLPVDWTALNATVTPGDTGVTAIWPAHPWNDFDEYYISIENMNTSGDNRILEKETRSVTGTSFSFDYTTSAYTLRSGSQVGVNIQSNNLWGFSSSYWTYITVP